MKVLEVVHELVRTGRKAPLRDIYYQLKGSLASHLFTRPSNLGGALEVASVSMPRHLHCFPTKFVTWGTATPQGCPCGGWDGGGVAEVTESITANSRIQTVIKQNLNCCCIRTPGEVISTDTGEQEGAFSKWSKKELSASGARRSFQQVVQEGAFSKWC